jgi:hypothetical protein
MTDRITLRRIGADHENLQPGDLLATTDPRMFIKACPKCGRLMATGEKHAITVHDDDTVTISPSCLCPYEDCDAHYFVNRSVISWC